MALLTTDAVPAPKRFGFFRDAASALFQFQLQRAGEDPFRGEVNVKEIGPLVITGIDAGGLRISRTASDIARSPLPLQAVYLVTVHLSGANSFRQCGEEVGLSGGDIFITDPLREFEFGCEAPFRRLCAKLPRDWIDARVARPDQLPGATIRRDHPLSRILASYLVNAFETAETLTPASAAIIAGHAVDLIGQALGEAPDGPSPSNALRAAIFVRARRIIGLRYGDPDLTPEHLSRDLGVSTRLLQRVFAERDQTVMSSIFEERVSRAAKLLAAPEAAHRSITDIAFACGFNDSAHFTRRFSAQMETTPSQWRKRAQ